MNVFYRKSMVAKTVSSELRPSERRDAPPVGTPVVVVSVADAAASLSPVVVAVVATALVTVPLGVT